MWFSCTVNEKFTAIIRCSIQSVKLKKQNQNTDSQIYPTPTINKPWILEQRQTNHDPPKATACYTTLVSFCYMRNHLRLLATETTVEKEEEAGRKKLLRAFVCKAIQYIVVRYCFFACVLLPLCLHPGWRTSRPSQPGNKTAIKQIKAILAYQAGETAGAIFRMPWVSLWHRA